MCKNREMLWILTITFGPIFADGPLHLRGHLSSNFRIRLGHVQITLGCCTQWSQRPKIGNILDSGSVCFHTSRIETLQRDALNSFDARKRNVAKTRGKPLLLQVNDCLLQRHSLTFVHRQRPCQLERNLCEELPGEMVGTREKSGELQTCENVAVSTLWSFPVSSSLKNSSSVQVSGLSVTMSNW